MIVQTHSQLKTIKYLPRNPNKCITRRYSENSGVGSISREVLDNFQRLKLDTSNDRSFYDFPRFVKHVDDEFLDKVTELYRQRIPSDGAVLDLMSSWVSHLPPEVKYSKVIGHGMNAMELMRNPRLDSFFVRNLNEEPDGWAAADKSFDAVVCCVSVQYLQQPERVFAEIFRVLKPGGVCIVTFSNRLFYSKIIKRYLDSKNEDLFRSYVEKLISDIKLAREDQQQRKLLEIFVQNYLIRGTQDDGVIDYSFKINFFEEEDFGINSFAIMFYGIMKGFSQLNAQQQGTVYQDLCEIWSGCSTVVGAVGNTALRLLQSTWGSVTLNGIAVLYVLYVWYNQGERKRKNEISWQRARKNGIDTTIGAGFGVAGVYAGIHLANIYVPGVPSVVLGAAVGGGVVCGGASFLVSDWATKKFFNLPKSEALENAYRFLDLPCNATNSKINDKYRELCCEYWPECARTGRGGTGKFIDLQMHFAKIKQAKQSSRVTEPWVMPGCHPDKFEILL